MGKKQPWGIKLTCLIMWIGAIVAGIGSVVTIALTDAMNTVVNSALFGIIGTVFTAVGVTASIMGIVIAVVMFLLAWALWKHYTIAWYIVFLLVLAQLVVAVGSTILAMSFNVMVLVSGALTAVILYALVSKDSMKACKAHLGKWKGLDT